MNKITFLLFMLSLGVANAQSSMRTLNSGAIIAPRSMISVGEIVVVPQAPNLSSNSGIIGILSQYNQQLEVSEFELADNIVAYPNPTLAKIYFKTTESLSNETISIYNNAGQLVLQNKVNTDNSVDLESLATGIYLIQFTNKKINTFKIIKH